MTGHVEYRNLLEKESVRTEVRTQHALRAFIEAWHGVHGKEIVFDKSRGWSMHALMLQKVCPEAKLIVLVRDVHEVFASIEKQHRKSALWNNMHPGIDQRANQLCGPQGMLGNACRGVEDLIRRDFDHVMFVKFAALCDHFQSTMRSIHSFLHETDFIYSDHIDNTAIDPDGHYLHKFPHRGDGVVRPYEPDTWQEFVPPDVATKLLATFPLYAHTFGYKEKDDDLATTDSVAPVVAGD